MADIVTLYTDQGLIDRCLPYGSVLLDCRECLALNGCLPAWLDWQDTTLQQRVQDSIGV